MPAKKATTSKKTTRSTQRYVRNIRNAVVALRYGDKPNLKHINLQGRGNRGDTAPLPKEAAQDARFRVDEGVLYEIISEAAAANVLEKQTHNQQSTHPALAGLRNAKDEKYESGVVVTESSEAQGKVVAHLEVDHEHPRREIGITRMAVPGSVENPILPGTDNVEAGIEGGEGLKVSMEPVQKTD